MRDNGMSRTKIFDETRHTCTFRTTKKDQENIYKAMEFFGNKFGKNISKNVAINLSLELVAKMYDENNRKQHTTNKTRKGNLAQQELSNTQTNKTVPEKGTVL